MAISCNQYANCLELRLFAKKTSFRTETLDTSLYISFCEANKSSCAFGNLCQLSVLSSALHYSYRRRGNKQALLLGVLHKPQYSCNKGHNWRSFKPKTNDGGRVT